MHTFGILPKGDAAADTLPGFEDQRVVPGTQEFAGGDQAGHAGADDDHLLWAGRCGLKTFASQGQIIQAAGIHTARFTTLPAKPSGQYYRPVQNESSTRRF